MRRLRRYFQITPLLFVLLMPCGCQRSGNNSLQITKQFGLSINEFVTRNPEFGQLSPTPGLTDIPGCVSLLGTIDIDGSPGELRVDFVSHMGMQFFSVRTNDVSVNGALYSGMVSEHGKPHEIDRGQDEWWVAYWHEENYQIAHFYDATESKVQIVYITHWMADQMDWTIMEI